MRRALALLVLAWAVVLCTAAPAGAHAALIRSNPYDGEQLAASPAHIELGFTERPDPALTVVTLVDATGQQAQVAKPAVVPGDARSIHVLVPQPLPNGVYTVVWRTTSLDDGHPSAGRLAFGVGTAAAPVGGEQGYTSDAASPYGAVGRWALVGGLALCLAAGACGLLVAPGRRPSARLLAVGGALAATGVVLTAVGESADADVSIGALLRADRGAVTIRLAVVVAVTCVAAVAAVRRPSRWPLAVLALAAAGGLATRAAAGHAAAPGPLRLAHVTVQTAHLVAIGVWMGGLVWLLVTLRGDPPTGTVRRFSRLAAGCLAVGVLTGTLRSVADLDAPSQLWSTSFGRVLLAKLGVVGALALAALGSRRRVHSGGGLHRTVGAEVALGAVVLGLSAVLAGLAPPGQAAPRRGAASLTATGHDFGMTTMVHLTASPGRPGVNQLAVHLSSHGSGDPVDAGRVSLRLSLPERPEIQPTVVDLANVGGQWEGSTAVISAPGRWTVTVVVERGADAVEVPVTLDVAVPRPG